MWRCPADVAPPWLPIATITNGRAPCAASASTAERAIVAIPAIPRLPTVTPIRAPRRMGRVASTCSTAARVAAAASATTGRGKRIVSGASSSSSSSIALRRPAQRLERGRQDDELRDRGTLGERENERDRLGDVFGTEHLRTHRGVGWPRPLVHDRRVDHPGLDRADADAALALLERRRVREGGQPALRRLVGRAGGVRPACGDAAHDDYVPARITQLREGRVNEIEGAGQVRSD